MLAVLKLDFSRAQRETSVKIQESQEKGSRNSGVTEKYLERVGRLLQGMGSQQEPLVWQAGEDPLPCILLRVLELCPSGRGSSPSFGQQVMGMGEGAAFRRFYSSLARDTQSWLEREREREKQGGVWGGNSRTEGPIWGRDQRS